MSSEPARRSRFDQVEPNIRRPSRFDRSSRSRSPVKAESKRTRSPPSDPRIRNGERADPAKAAAAAAAKIQAQLQGRNETEAQDRPSARPEPTPKEIYERDGDFIKDIEINDLKNRYTLTRGSTQKMIKDQTGADVTTRGEYYPDKAMATASKPPLYLHVTSTSREGVEKAIELINELIKIELPPLIDERRLRRAEENERNQEPGPREERSDQHSRRPPLDRDDRDRDRGQDDRYRRRAGIEDKVSIDLEPIGGFNLRAQVVGHGGAYVKHIQTETGCRIQIKGRGSGFVDRATGLESDEPMFLHIMGYEPEAVAHAKELCQDLLGNVRKNYEGFKERGQSQGYGRRRYDRDDHNRDGRDRHHRDRHHDGDRRGGRERDGWESQDRPHNTYQPRDDRYSGQTESPAPTSATAQTPASASDYAAAGYDAAAYAAAAAAQYPPGQDPYAAYGGYQNYVAMYYHYYGQQMPTDTGAMGAEHQEGTGAPPPPRENAPPPPPGEGDANAPPPPPGV